MKDDIGNRMKDFYESRTRMFLPRRTYTIIRVDGKAFHTYTRGLNIPFDKKFMDNMDKTSCYMCENIQGAQFAFVQSDEISILLTDFKKLGTSAWFDGNVQKMVSVSSSMATSNFNQLMTRLFDEKGSFQTLHSMQLAEFDSRVFTIPSSVEVENYFIWRQMDTIRNSISSVAQSLYSSKQLYGKNTTEMQDMCIEKNVNWNDFPVKEKRGRLITREIYDKDGAIRSRWISEEPPIFTQDRERLGELIPKLDML